MSYLENLLNVYTGNTDGLNNNNQNNINTSFTGNNNNDNSLFNLLTQKISGTQGLQAQNQNQNQNQGQGQAQNPTNSLFNPSQMNTQNQLAYTAGRLGNMAIKAALL